MGGRDVYGAPGVCPRRTCHTLGQRAQFLQ